MKSILQNASYGPIALFFALSILLPSSAYAGFHNCTGKIKNLVTRATSENTSVQIEGMTGWAKIGYGGDAQKEMQNRQFAMLMGAWMTGRPVTLEFSDDTVTSCSQDHSSLKIRFVMVTPD